MATKKAALSEDEGENLAPQLIDARIKELGDWRGEMLARLRALIKQADPSRLFNASLEGNARRVIDFHEGDEIDESALKALILAAVALNTAPKLATRSVRTTRAKTQ